MLQHFLHMIQPLLLNHRLVHANFVEILCQFEWLDVRLLGRFFNDGAKLDFQLVADDGERGLSCESRKEGQLFNFK